MAKSKDIHNPEAVTAFIQNLAPAFGELIEAIRKTILSADKEVGEQIKWNSPSFFYTGEMKAFNPKEYKRDIVVVNIHKGYALLVFPTGATIPDSTGLLEGDYKDGRRMITIKDMAEFNTKEKGLKTVVKEWLKLVEK